MIADAGGAERQVKREKEGRGQSIPASSTSTISDNVEGRGRAQHRGLWLNTRQNNHGIRGLSQSGKRSRPLSTAAMAVNVFFASAARLFFSVKRPPRFFPRRDGALPLFRLTLLIRPRQDQLPCLRSSRKGSLNPSLSNESSPVRPSELVGLCHYGEVSPTADLEVWRIV